MKTLVSALGLLIGSNVMAVAADQTLKIKLVAFYTGEKDGEYHFVGATVSPNGTIGTKDFSVKEDQNGKGAGQSTYYFPDGSIVTTDSFVDTATQTGGHVVGKIQIISGTGAYQGATGTGGFEGDLGDKSPLKGAGLYNIELGVKTPGNIRRPYPRRPAANGAAAFDLPTPGRSPGANELAKSGDPVMRQAIMIFAAGAALGGLLAAPPAHALGYSFTDLDVPGSQPGSTGAFDGLAINNLGQIAGSYVNSAGNFNGFVFAGGKYVSVDAPGAIDTNLYGINDFGQILGTAVYSNGTSQNFIDTNGKFTVISNAISPAGPANPLNDRDQIFGSIGFPNFGILDANGVITPFNLPGAPGSAFATGFNNLDQLTGLLFNSTGAHAFIDKNGVYTIIDDPNAAPGTDQGDGINDLDQVVGQDFDSAGSNHGFLYSNGRFTTIDDPKGSLVMGGTAPIAINDLGEIVGWYFDAQGNADAFLATPSLLPFALATAAQVADPVPEPSTWAMMLLGLSGLGFVSLRTRATKLALSVALTRSARALSSPGGRA